MNLIDLLKRKDRALPVVPETIHVAKVTRDGFKQQAIIFPVGTTLRIHHAHEFVELQSFPQTLGWQALLNEKGAGCRLKIRAVNEDAQYAATLTDMTLSTADRWTQVVLNWPPGIGQIRSYDLVVECEERTRDGWRRLLQSPPAAVLGITPLFDSRRFVPDLIRGFGVEVGPGSNPHIHPSSQTDVRYVESATSEEWARRYKKTSEDGNAEAGGTPLWDRYTIGNAGELDSFEDGTLDFIFSNHVFEHLINPLGVLHNWSRKLRSSGLVYTVIPNARACFDLRQPLSTPQQWQEEFAQQRWTLDRTYYEKWCRYTAPYNNPDDLIARGYSIHVHYYSADTAAQLACMAIAQGLYAGYYITASPNHKDFAFVLFKDANGRVPPRPLSHD